MKIKEIYTYLDSLSPFELQESWDNSGLIVGNMSDSFENLYISMDLDLELVQDLKPNSLVITHHPLIFSGLKKVNYDTYSTKILKELIKKDIALISMHTNIDKTHLNRYFVEKVLLYSVESSEDFIVTCKVDMSFENLLKDLSSKLNTKNLKFTKTKDYINTLAICTGSAMSLLDFVKTDCFLTGDIKYHDAMEASARDICLVDIRHYESERCFNLVLEELLEEYLKKNKLKAIITASKNPFQFFIEGETIE